MDAREELKEVRRARLRVEALAERRKMCRELRGCVTLERAAGLEELQRELDARALEYVERVMDVERRIDAVGDDLRRDVLRYRYLNGWSWREISARSGLSQDWLKHVHGRAVRDFYATGEISCTTPRNDTFSGGQ